MYPQYYANCILIYPKNQVLLSIACKVAVAYKAQHDLTSVSSLTSFPIALSSITVVYLLFLEGTRHKAHSHFTILH